MPNILNIFPNVSSHTYTPYPFYLINFSSLSISPLCPLSRINFFSVTMTKIAINFHNHILILIYGLVCSEFEFWFVGQLSLALKFWFEHRRVARIWKRGGLF